MLTITNTRAASAEISLTPSVMVSKMDIATWRLAERAFCAVRITLYYTYLYFYHQQSRPRFWREPMAGSQSHLCHTAERKGGCGGMVVKLNMFNYIIIMIITTTPAYARTCADTSAIAPAALLRIIARHETVVSGYEIRKSCFAIVVSCPEINI